MNGTCNDKRADELARMAESWGWSSVVVTYDLFAKRYRVWGIHNGHESTVYAK